MRALGQVPRCLLAKRVVVVDTPLAVDVGPPYLGRVFRHRLSAWTRLLSRGERGCRVIRGSTVVE